MGGPIESKPGEYAERTVVLRAEDIKASGVRGVTLVHGADDGLVPYSQSREIQARLRGLNIPTDMVTVGTRGEASEPGTTLTGSFGPPGYTSPFAGHADEASTTHIVGNSGFERLSAYFRRGRDAPLPRVRGRRDDADDDAGRPRTAADRSSPRPRRSQRSPEPRPTLLLVGERGEDVGPRRAPRREHGRGHARQRRDHGDRHEGAAGTANSSPYSLSAAVTAAARPRPTPMPGSAPMSAVITLSWRTMRRSWRRDMPIARSVPSSRRRSNVASTSVLTIPNSETITASASSTHRTPRIEPIHSVCLVMNASLAEHLHLREGGQRPAHGARARRRPG